MRGTSAFLAIALLACAETPGEPVGGVQPHAAVATNGYSHKFGQSRFAVGPSWVAKAEFGLDKIVGDWGVFATNQKTGMVLALPNADAPSQARSALAGGPDVHNTAVKSYFVGAGLPATEIDKVSVFGKMSAGGSGTDDPVDWQFASYTSRIDRRHAGLPVVDSFAWAQINDLGEVVTESVYWPQIPDKVAADALSFKAKLADPAFSSKFFDGGRLVIRHTSGAWAGPFEAVVSYDVEGFKTFHYDANGNEFELAEEKSQ